MLSFLKPQNCDKNKSHGLMAQVLTPVFMLKLFVSLRYLAGKHRLK